MSSTNSVANTSTTNIVPVQAEFDSAGACLGLVGPAGAYFSPPITGSTINNTVITGSTINNTVIGGTTPAAVTGTTVYASSELGYSAAAQGTVTQLTSKTTAVTLDKSAGRITMNNASLNTATNATFTLNNSTISVNDTVILTISGGQATPGSYNVFANALSAGSVSISLRNISGGTLSEAVVINFCIIHNA
jgi:hypothetical protein